VDDTLEFCAVLTRPADDVVVVAFSGELGFHTAFELREALARAIDEGAGCVVVDLTAVTFIDSTTLGVLVAGGKELQLRDGTLLIVCGDDRTGRILEIVGLDGQFAVHATLDDALGVGV
jgi:anti-sigma B factor antagonist